MAFTGKQLEEWKQEFSGRADSEAAIANMLIAEIEHLHVEIERLKEAQKREHLHVEIERLKRGK